MSIKYKRRAPAKLIVMGVLFVVMTLAATAGIVAVLAATSRSITSNVNITYTAVDIDGEVEAAYKIGDSGTWTSMNGSSPYRFAADDQTSNKQMNPANIELTSQNRYVEFRYIFRNFGHVDYTAILSLNEVDESNNIKLDYKYNNNSYTSTGYGLVIEGTNSPVAGKVQTNEDGEEYVEMTYYVKASVKQLTRDANYQSDFFWLLENYEAQPGEETIRLATSNYTDNGDGTYSASYSGANISVASMMAGNSNIENIWNVPSRFGSASVTKVKKGDELPANTKVVLSDSITTIEEGTFSVYSGDGVPVGSLGLFEIVIGKGVTELSNLIFAFCSNLRSVTIGSGVTSIGNNAFSSCTSLTSVVIPDSVTSIGEASFSSCESLKSVEIGSRVTSIKSSAFINCTGLKEITIPNSVTSIGDSAFSGCVNLKEITIPTSVTTIGDSAFGGCVGVEVLNYNGSVSSFHYLRPVFPGLGENANTILNINSATVPMYTFKNAAINEVHLGSQVETFNLNAFEHVTGLRNISVHENNLVYSSENNCLFNKNKTKLIFALANHIPSTVTIIGSHAFSSDFGSSVCGDIVLPNSVTTLEEYSFAGSAVSSIEISDSVTSIGGFTFDSCANLTSVKIGSGVTVINGGTFQNCYSLSTLWLPSTVLTIQDGPPTFYIPSGITIYAEVNAQPSGWVIGISSSFVSFKWGYTYEAYLAEINK